MPKRRTFTLVVAKSFRAEDDHFPKGEIVGHIETILPMGTLMSVMGIAGRVKAIDDSIEDQPTEPPAEEPSDAEQPPEQSTAQPTEQPTEQSGSPIPAAGRVAEGEGPEAAGEETLILAGVPDKAIEVLRENGLETVEEVITWLADDNELSDLDGMTKKLATDTRKALKV